MRPRPWAPVPPAKRPAPGSDDSTETTGTDPQPAQSAAPGAQATPRPRRSSPRLAPKSTGASAEATSRPRAPRASSTPRAHAHPPPRAGRGVSPCQEILDVHQLMNVLQHLRKKGIRLARIVNDSYSQLECQKNHKTSDVSTSVIEYAASTLIANLAYKVMMENFSIPVISVH